MSTQEKKNKSIADLMNTGTFSGFNRNIMQQIGDKVTITTGQFRNGVLNINTASDKVLEALFLGINIQYAHPMSVGTDVDYDKLIHYKSLGGILALQEKIAADWSARQVMTPVLLAAQTGDDMTVSHQQAVQ